MCFCCFESSSLIVSIMLLSGHCKCKIRPLAMYPHGALQIDALKEDEALIIHNPFPARIGSPSANLCNPGPNTWPSSNHKCSLIGRTIKLDVGSGEVPWTPKLSQLLEMLLIQLNKPTLASLQPSSKIRIPKLPLCTYSH
jgi:hypothetical protein